MTTLSARELAKTYEHRRVVDGISLEVSAGGGFEATSAGLDGQRWVRFAALGLFALAQLIYYLGSLRKSVPEGAAVETSAEATGEEAPEEDDEELLPPPLPTLWAWIP